MKPKVPIGLRTPTVQELWHGTIVDGVKIGKKIAIKTLLAAQSIKRKIKKRR